MSIIDLRSDTVTLPTEPMRAAMMAAELGDDVYGEDPTVNALEEKAASMLGKESALFAPSGTQSNLLALMAHCERGDEYIVGEKAHTYRYEGGGAAVLGSIQPQPLPFNIRGELFLESIESVIKPDDFHFAKTRLLCLENTVAGKVVSLDYMQAAGELAKKHNLGFHLDGARAFNAAVKLKVDIEELVRPFDSVSICLSKGLGAPVGSVLVGSKKLIERARRWRKVLGGGMRQAGLLAAAGIYALDHHVERLQKDHETTQHLADGLALIEGIELKEKPQTNMCFVYAERMEALVVHLENDGIKVTPGMPMRLVTHLDVSHADIDKVVKSVRDFYSHL